jgi:tetratricopeptide (TPR) repeat protein
VFEHNSHLQRFRDQDPAGQAQLWLDAGRIAARRGDTQGARQFFRSAAQADPGCVEAWLRLAWLTPEPRERRSLLRGVLALDPANVRARTELDRLERQPSPQPAESPVLIVPPPGRGGQPVRRQAGGAARRRWALAVLLAAAGLLAALLIWGPVETSVAWLLPTPTPTAQPAPTQTPREIVAQFVPQLKRAIAEASWKRALEIVEIMSSVDATGESVRGWAVDTRLQYGQALLQAGDLPGASTQFEQALALAPDDARARAWAADTHARLGQELVQAGDVAGAKAQFEQALAVAPDNAMAQLWQQIIGSYQTGQQALAAGNWDGAIAAFALVRDKMPGTLDAETLLAQAYRKRGMARHEAGQLAWARADLEAALALRPGDSEARTHLDQVMAALRPAKRIDIDLSAQRFYAYEGDKLVYSFLTSTGLPGQDTAPGHFKVLDKIPMAYSSIWNLQMPYWLGIYYVGSTENGIHALPIRPDGSVMWGGLLGTRQSYGCVILSTEAAKQIYDWAEVGTAVDIHY